jgi:hypothetical protein
MRTPEERKIMELRRVRNWKRVKREGLAYGTAAVVVAVAIYIITRPPS